MIRLMSASSSCSGSVIAQQLSCARSSDSRSAPPADCSSSGRMSSSRTHRSTSVNVNFCWREKARSWPVSLAARLAEDRPLAAIRRARASMSCRFDNRSSAPTIGVSRLLKSCAIPPVSWPSASELLGLLKPLGRPPAFPDLAQNDEHHQRGEREREHPGESERAERPQSRRVDRPIVHRDVRRPASQIGPGESRVIGEAFQRVTRVDARRFARGDGRPKIFRPISTDHLGVVEGARDEASVGGNQPADLIGFACRRKQALERLRRLEDGQLVGAADPRRVARESDAWAAFALPYDGPEGRRRSADRGCCRSRLAKPFSRVEYQRAVHGAGEDDPDPMRLRIGRSFGAVEERLQVAPGDRLRAPQHVQRAKRA